MILRANHEATASTEPILFPPAPERKLDPHHRRELAEGSGLSEETIRAMGVYSESNETRQRMLLNWTTPSRNKFANGAMVIPGLLRMVGGCRYQTTG